MGSAGHNEPAGGSADHEDEVAGPVRLSQIVSRFRLRRILFQPEQQVVTTSPFVTHPGLRSAYPEFSHRVAASSPFVTQEFSCTSIQDGPSATPEPAPLRRARGSSFGSPAAPATGPERPAGGHAGIQVLNKSADGIGCGDLVCITARNAGICVLDMFSCPRIKTTASPSGNRRKSTPFR